jgi:hypothetical protein
MDDVIWFFLRAKTHRARPKTTEKTEKFVSGGDSPQPMLLQQALAKARQAEVFSAADFHRAPVPANERTVPAHEYFPRTKTKPRWVSCVSASNFKEAV